MSKTIEHYRRRITELTNELHHYVSQYNELISKETKNRRKEHNELKEEKRKKKPTKRT